jgi:hypothetical protein
MKIFYRMFVLLAVYFGAANLLFGQWEKINNIQANAFISFAVNGTNIFVGTDGAGVYLSTNSGVNWNSVNNGLTNLHVNAIFTTDNNIFIGSDSGVYVSTHNGSNWSYINNGLKFKITSLSKIYNNLLIGTNNGVYKSINNGVDVESISNGFIEPEINSLAAVNGYLFAASRGTYFSTDTGSHWYEYAVGVQGFYGSCLAVMGTQVFVNANWQAGVCYHKFDGTGWNYLRTGLPEYESVSYITASGTDVFTSVQSSVYRLANEHAIWVSAGDEFTSSMIRSMIADDTYLYAGTVNDGIWRRSLSEIKPNSTIAASEVWSVVTNNDSPPGQITFDKYSDGSITVKGNWFCIYQGLTVEGVIARGTAVKNNAMISMTFQGKAADSTGYQTSGYENKLEGSIANGNCSGNYDISLTGWGWPSNLQGTFTATKISGSGVTDGANDMEEMTNKTITHTFTLSQNYPNPFNPSTSISFSIPHQIFVSLKVFDALGREVATIISEQLSGGSYTRQFNASNISSGIYFYRLQAGLLTETKKFVLLR